MSELQEAQRAMGRFLRDPEGHGAPEGIEERRLQVYRDLVYRNLEGFISSAFPVLRSLYTDEHWEARVRAFMQHHRCATPLFLRISEEYLAYLTSLPADQVLPFEAELAHYEWLELAVDVAEGEVPGLRGDENAAHLRPRVSPVARLASYQYPVHRIGPSFQPEAPGEPVFLLVYRDRESRVQFMELNAASARLIHEIDRAGEGVAAPAETDQVESAEQLLQRLAEAWQADVAAFTAFGWQQLCEFNDLGIIALEPRTG